MALNIFGDGTGGTSGPGIASSPMNSNFNAALTLMLNNHGRQLIDRVGVYSADGTDCWGEAYVSAGGQNASVDTVNTTAGFDTDKYIAYNYDILSDLTTTNTAITGSAISSPDNFFDSNDATSATQTQTGSGAYTIESALGKTFSSKLVNYVRVYCAGSISNTSSYTKGSQAYLETYNGTSWTTHTTLWNVPDATYASAISESYNNFVSINASVQGVRVRIREYYSGAGGNTSTSTFYTIEISSEDSIESIIIHTIPSGIFSSTISSAIGSGLIADWEAGADVQFKLQSNAKSNITGTDTTTSWTDGSNAFDLDKNTYAYTTSSGVYIQKTFSAQTVEKAYYKFGVNGNHGNTTITLETYNGSTWSTHTTILSQSGLNTTRTYSGLIDIGSSIQGYRLKFVQQYSAKLDCYELDKAELSEDSGYLNTKEVVTFTAFTAEPTTLIVKLIPKTTSPTTGFPSIKTFTLLAK